MSAELRRKVQRLSAGAGGSFWQAAAAGLGGAKCAGEGFVLAASRVTGRGGGGEWEGQRAAREEGYRPLCAKAQGNDARGP